MADVYAVKSGNWSDTTLWNTGSLPAAIDNVYSNNFTVYVDISPQVNLVTNIASTGITAGGGFILNDNISLSALVAGGGVANIAAVQFLSASPFSSTIVGNISSNGIGVTNSVALLHNGTGTLTVLGSAVGGVNNAGSVSNGYIRVNSSGTFNIIGDVLGAGTGAGFYGINNASTGTVNITGNVTGNIGTANTNYGVVNSSTGTVNIRGNVVSGLTGTVAPGAINNSTGSLNIFGNVVSRGSTGAVNSSTGTLSITGNVNGSQTGTNQVGISNNGTCIVYGNVAGGPEVAGGAGGNAYGINNAAATSVLTVYGNVSGAGFVTATGVGIFNNTGIVNVVGNVHGRAAPGAQNNTGTVNLTGNCIGGPVAGVYGFNNLATGTAIISGSAIGGLGSGAHGAFNGSTGVLRVQRAVGNDWGLGYTTALGPAAGVASGVAGSQTFVQELQMGPRGQWPTAGNIYFTPNPKATSQFETDTFQNYSLIQSISADNLLPPVSSVRQGTVYDLGTDTGTCIIPPASSVALNIPVDNTTGIATLTPTNVWNISSQEITDNQSIGGRLKNTLTANAAERLVNSFNLN
jgi:hypothetical protein